MKGNDFSKLCSLVRRNWTRREGVILRMHELGSDKPELLLCVGGARNPELVARECIVWSGDTKVYAGSLENPELRQVLGQAGVCYCEITNARLMEHDATGTFVCLLSSANIECEKDCPLKNTQEE